MSAQHRGEVGAGQNCFFFFFHLICQMEMYIVNKYHWARVHLTLNKQHLSHRAHGWRVYSCSSAQQRGCGEGET